MFSLTNTANSLYDAALALVYPQSCAVCGASVESRFDGVVCAGCWQEARVFSGDDSLCWQCGALASAIVDGADEEKVRCHRCDDAAFTAARACGPYAGALRALIIDLKRRPNLAKRLVLQMTEIARRSPLNEATRVLPVPLHPEREKQRGFNQATVLARAVAEILRLPLDEHALARREHTGRHRAGMDARARAESVEGVFVVTQPRTIVGEHILLVDDVFTTGATASACARVLRDAGAEQILVLTIARPV